MKELLEAIEEALLLLPSKEVALSVSIYLYDESGLNPINELEVVQNGEDSEALVISTIVTHLYQYRLTHELKETAYTLRIEQEDDCKVIYLSIHL